MRRVVGPIVAAAFGLMLSSGTASAAVVFAPCTIVGFNPTELAGNITCPQFNTPGTLTNISLYLQGDVQGSITLTAGVADANGVVGSSSSQFFFGPLAGFTIGSPLFIAGFTTGAPVNIPAGNSQTFPGLAGSSNTTVNNNTTFAPYTGAGNFLIPVSTLTFFGGSGGGGNLTVSTETQARALAEVTYTYDPPGDVIPEPTTLTLLGTGLLGLAYRRRRRS
jgi:hypothetical protein